MRTVLFMCVINATRSLMAEALVNHLGAGRFRAFSAGEYASGGLHPVALECLTAQGILTVGLYSKTWHQYARLGAPHIDLVITLCDGSTEDLTPRWWHEPIKAHWNTANPAAVRGTDDEVRRAFESTFDLLRRRIELLLQLPLDGLDKIAQWRQIMRVGEIR